MLCRAHLSSFPGVPDINKFLLCIHYGGEKFFHGVCCSFFFFLVRANQMLQVKTSCSHHIGISERGEIWTPMLMLGGKVELRAVIPKG